jgi:hypothetical protein
VIDDKAGAFAEAHGSFCLHFDASQNPSSPDWRPWTLVLDGGEDRAWGGLTALEALDFAAAELGMARYAVLRLEHGLTRDIAEEEPEP